MIALILSLTAMLLSNPSPTLIPPVEKNVRIRRVPRGVLMYFLFTVRDTVDSSISTFAATETIVSGTSSPPSK